MAKVEDCKISRQSTTLELPFHGGIFGSCAAYNGKIWTCFDGKEGRANQCITFDGVRQEIVAHQTTRGHDWSDLVVYEDELVTIGGCDGDGEQRECHGFTEIYVEETGWYSNLGSNFPVHALSGHALVSDPRGIVIITDTKNSNTIYRLDFIDLPSGEFVYRWDTLGKLRAPALTISATNLLEAVFVGYNKLERITTGPFELTSSIVYDTGFNLRLDHAPMLIVDENFCKE